MRKPSRKRDVDDAIALGASQTASEAAVNFARATSSIDAHWTPIEKMLKDEFNKLNHPTGAGHIFEVLNDFQENQLAVLRGSSNQSVNTRQEHLNTFPADSVRRNRGVLVDTRQDKFIHADTPITDQILDKIADPNYSGEFMDDLRFGDRLVVPSDRFKEVRDGFWRRWEKTGDDKYLDAHRRLEPGASTAQVKRLIENGKGFKQQTMQVAFARELMVTATTAAAVAGVVTGVVSTISNGISFLKSEKTGAEAAAAVGGDTARATVRAGVQATIVIALERTGKAAVAEAAKSGARAGARAALATSATSVAVAAALIDVALTVYDFSTGKATTGEVVERLGQTGCSTVAGLFVGKAAAAAFGKAGVVKLAVAGGTMAVNFPVLIASTASYIAMTMLYQATIQIFKTARLEVAQAERLIALATAAEAEIRKQRERFEQLAGQHLQERQAEFDRAFAAIAAGLETDHLTLTLSGLSGLAWVVGGRLKFQSFEEFDQFMTDPNSTLVL